LIQWGKISYSNSAFVLYQSMLGISEIYIKESRTGYKFSEGENNSLINCISICNGTEDSNISLIGSNNFIFENNILIADNLVFEMENSVCEIFQNNFIINNMDGVAIFVKTDSSLDINNCHIVSQNYGVITNAESILNISFSNIISKRGVYFQPHGYSGDSNGLINHNNINCEVYAIKLLGSQVLPNIDSLDCKYNYYFTLDEIEIEENLIQDKNDLDETDVFYEHTGYITWSPYLYEENESAGIGD